MKSFVFYIMLSCSALFIHSCATQKTQNGAAQFQMINSGKFSFHAERANPMDIDVINVMNSMPAMSSSRMLTLDPGYTLDFTKEKITLKLPYFGRMYVGTLDPSQNGFDFTSTDFNINSSRSTEKKTIWMITFNDQPNIRQMYLEMYPNGKAYLSVNSADRQAITYDGFIGKNSN